MPLRPPSCRRQSAACPGGRVESPARQAIGRAAGSAAGRRACRRADDPSRSSAPRGGRYPASSRPCGRVRGRDHAVRSTEGWCLPVRQRDRGGECAVRAEGPASARPLWHHGGCPPPRGAHGGAGHGRQPVPRRLDQRPRRAGRTRHGRARPHPEPAKAPVLASAAGVRRLAQRLVTYCRGTCMRHPHRPPCGSSTRDRHRAVARRRADLRVVRPPPAPPASRHLAGSGSASPSTRRPYCGHHPYRA